MKNILRGGGISLIVLPLLNLYIREDYSVISTVCIIIGAISVILSRFIKSAAQSKIAWVETALADNDDMAINTYIEHNGFRYELSVIPGIEKIREHYEFKLSTANNFAKEYEALRAVLSDSTLELIFWKRFSVDNLDTDMRLDIYQQYIESVSTATKGREEFRKYLRTMLKTYNSKKDRRLLVKECKAVMLEELEKSDDLLYLANLENALELFRMEVGCPSFWHFIYEISLENYNPNPNPVENECWMDVKNECMIISDSKDFPLKEAHEQTQKYFKASNAFISSYRLSCKKEYDKANFIEEYEQIACVHIIKIRKPAKQ